MMMLSQYFMKVEKAFLSVSRKEIGPQKVISKVSRTGRTVNVIVDQNGHDLVGPQWTHWMFYSDRFISSNDILDAGALLPLNITFERAKDFATRRGINTSTYNIFLYYTKVEGLPHYQAFSRSVLFNSLIPFGGDFETDYLNLWRYFKGQYYKSLWKEVKSTTIFKDSALGKGNEVTFSEIGNQIWTL